MIQLKDRTRNILLVAGGLFILFLIWYFSTIVTYILISGVLAFIGRPLVRRLERIKFRNFKIPNGLAAFITLISLLAIIVTFFRFIIPLLVSELETLSQVDFSALLGSLEEPVSRLSRLFGNESITLKNRTFFDVLNENLGDKIDFSRFSDVFGFIAGIIGELFIAFFSVSFITFFFLKEESLLRDGILMIVPTDMEEKVSHILDSITYLLRRYFIGLILEIVMVGFLDTLGLKLIGLEFNHAVVIGLFCGLFNVIPYLGPFIGGAFGLLVGLALNINADLMNYTIPLLGSMAIVFLIVKIIDDVLFQPLIYSSSVKAHPLDIFLIILAAGSMAGVLGMMLAIPGYTILRVIAREFFVNLKIVKKLTENLDQKEDIKYFHKK
jgi:predicted PurR-regulated permease PerM